MITSSPLFALGIKVLGLTAIAAILFSANLAIGIQSSYAQFPLGERQRGEEQVASDGGLTATLNSDSFRRGDTITVSGTVEEREIDSFAVIEVIDPESESVVRAYPDITADNTFTYSFTAGEAEVIFDEPMTVSGNYRMTVRYTVPGEDFETEQVEFVFAYDAESQTTTATQGGSAGTTTTTAPPSTIFQSNEDGFRIGVLDGWVVDDIDNTDPTEQQREQRAGFNVLAQICLEATAIPQIGGGYTCGGSDVAEKVIIYRHSDLKSKPEFAEIVQQNQNITISDFTAYIIQHFFVEMFGYTNFNIQEREDRTFNVIDPATNQTVTTADAQWIIFTYDDPDEFVFTGTTSLNMIVLSPDGNTGYILEPSGEFSEGETRLPDQEQMIDSFELLSNATAGTVASTGTSPPTTTITAPAPQEEEEQQAASSPLTQQLQLPVQQQQLQQQQENLGTSVSIVPGSSSLTTNAYHPNPVAISIGDSAIWTNEDAQPHTVTSGENVTPDGRFDSGIMTPAADFEHTFTAEGEYPYFCLLHPNMVGTISVN